MSVFSQIKSFMKSGKSYPSNSSNHSRHSNSQKYETAARIVEEENKAKSTMPTYPGLEQFKLISKLGDGAFSKVYQAERVADLHEQVAIKVVRKHELTNQQKASVLKEAQIMRTLDHPSIIKMLDFKETEEHYFLILELCQGGEIFHQIVRLTYFSEELARHVIRQVAEGVRYLHEEKGVVHRDIKPENLLFSPIEFMERDVPLPPTFEYDEPKEDEGKFVLGVGGGGIGAVKIADFGLSKVVWDQQTMTPCGTVGYTAPEIVKDQRYSKSVDMWALGCVLYTLLCGFPPFYDESIKVLTEKVAKGDYTFLSPWWDDISGGAKDLIENLLNIDPEKRYSIIEFLDHPWMKEVKIPNTDKQVNVSSTTSTDIHTDLSKVPMFTSLENIDIPSTDETVNSQDKSETEAEAFKRMIQERNRDQEELEAAAPMTYSGGTIPSVINSRVNSRSTSRAPSIAASGTTTPRRDLVSGVSSMKEMFDISYTVHRITEEKMRRKNLKLQQQQNGGEDTNVNRRSLFMAEVNGDDNDNITEDEADMTTDETSSTQTNSDDAAVPVDTVAEEEGVLAVVEPISGVEDTSLDGLKALTVEDPTHSPVILEKKPVSPTNKKVTRSSKHHHGPFELNIENSTLLGRRKH